MFTEEINVELTNTMPGNSNLQLELQFKIPNIPGKNFPRLV